jgi:hypothetical protein
MLRCVSLIALGLFSGVAAAESPAAAVLLNHNLKQRLSASAPPYFRNFAQDAIPRTGSWLGLFCRKGGCELKEANVTVLSGTAASCNDEEAYAETVHAAGNPMVVINGLDLRVGKVSTLLVASRVPQDSPHYKRLRKAGQWQVQMKGSLLGVSWIRMQLPKSPDKYQYRYHFGNGAAKQFFYSSVGTRAENGGAVTPFVHWAGDLDGDGKVDLLVEIPAAEGDTCESGYRLYLSSRATGGEVLHKVSQMAGRKPGCGC